MIYFFIILFCFDGEHNLVGGINNSLGYLMGYVYCYICINTYVKHGVIIYCYKIQIYLRIFALIIDYNFSSDHQN